MPRAGRRFISISPHATVDGGLELLTADGALAARLQRAVRALPMEFSLRVRGELSEQQRQAILKGMLDSGACCVSRCSSPPAARRVTAGTGWWHGAPAATQCASSSSAQAATLVRAAAHALGALTLPRTLPRGHWRRLTPAELAAVHGAQPALLGSPGSGR